MGHSIDGYDLTFTSRRSWKANLRARGKIIDIIPVTWTHGRKGDVQEVWYQNPDELEEARLRDVPFVVALAHAKDPYAEPSEFHEFRGVFEVIATGGRLGEQSIETKVIRRLKADDEE